MKVQRARNLTAIGGDELVARPPVGGGDEGDGDGEGGEEEERLPWGGRAQARLGFYGGKGISGLLMGWAGPVRRLQAQNREQKLHLVHGPASSEAFHMYRNVVWPV